MKTQIITIAIALFFSVSGFPQPEMAPAPPDNTQDEVFMEPGQGAGQFGGRGFRMQRLLDDLNLTDQQKDQIASLREAHQKEMIDMRASLQKAELDLRSISRKGGFSRSDYLSAVDKVTKIKDQIAVKRANHLMDVYEKLTPEQKKIWSERKSADFDGTRLNRRIKSGGFYKNGRNSGGMGMGMNNGSGACLRDGSCYRLNQN